MNELTIHLQPDTGIPLYGADLCFMINKIYRRQTEKRRKAAFYRQLCQHLEIKQEYGELAYEQLLSEGYVEARPCKGYFVSEIEGLYSLKRPVKAIEEEVKHKEKKIPV